MKVLSDPLLLQRASYWLHVRGHKRLARLVKAVIFLVFHAILPPEVRVGRGTHLGHRGLGIVVHPRTVIGERVMIYHGVTLATDVPLDDAREMVIENDVFIGVGATVLGPVRIGAKARIGAGAVVTADVPTGITVVGVPARPLG